MSNSWTPKPKVIERALILNDVNGIPRVVATDGAGIAWWCGEEGTDAENVGLVRSSFDLEGFWLFTGSMYTYYSGLEQEESFDWRGDLRRVTLDELPGLLAMAPPADPELEAALDDGPDDADRFPGGSFA